MGGRRHIRDAFFKVQPVCCFCGGNVPATQEDPIPARSLFLRREWPQGYVFPACGTCNRASSDDELAMAWLVRIAISDVNGEAEKEMARALRQLNDRRPNWVSGMRELSRVETRRRLRERGLSLQSFQGLDDGPITIPQELLAVPERYGVKLGKALYSMHTSRVVPLVGIVKTFVYANSDFLSAEFPRDNFNLLASKPVIGRSGKSLEDQFAYRFAIAEDGGAGAFLLQFGERVAVLALVFEDAERFESTRSRGRESDSTTLIGRPDVTA